MIDIVIPAHSGGPLLWSAIQSVCRQASPQWRLYVVDDASPGTGIRDLVANVAHPQVSYHRNPTKLGINGQFNHALTTGFSDYLVIMGEDDEMLPGYVSQVGECISSFERAVVVQPGVEVIDWDGRIVRPLGDRIKHRLAPKPDKPTQYGGEDLLVSLLQGNWSYFPSLCWRRSLIGGLRFPKQYEVVQDLALLIDVLRRGHGLVVDPKPAFRYRRHAGSLSSVRAVDGERFKEEQAYFRKVAQELGAAGQHRGARAARWHLTSRLHALSRLPAAARHRDGNAIRQLVQHVAR